MCGGLAIALHPIEVIGDAIDFCRRILNSLGRAIRGLGRFVRCRLRLCRRLFGMLGGSLSLGRRRFGLGSLLLVARRASRKRKGERQRKQSRRN